ncbi:MAG: PDZ domain-containing protein [Clostridia bacterium]|nr:PDZ domain-containing protein [Clostridia bacterium]
MKRQISVASSIVLVIIGALFTFQLTCRVLNDKYQKKLDQISDGRQDFSKLFAVQEILKKNYVGAIDPASLDAASVSGYLESLSDGRCRYLDKNALFDYLLLGSGSLRGPGFDTVCDKEGNVFISRVIGGTGAEDSGLLVGDRIVSVNSRPVSGLSPSQLRELVWSQSGDKVSVVCSRAGASFTADVAVKTFDYPSVSFSLEGNEAYVRIWLFTSRTADELSAAFESFKNSLVDSLVIDLRSCDWGSFENASAVLDRLVSDLPYARTYSSVEDVTVLRASYGTILPLSPTVWVDSSTSGAAELVAASLRDCSGAGLVGSATAGNGAVQTLFRLSDQTAVLIVTRYFAPPVSASFEGIGLTCDAETDSFVFPSVPAQ